MTHLIALVIAIAISGFVVLGGTNYINFDSFDKIKIKNEILSDYTNLLNGRSIYMQHTDLNLTVLNWEDEIKEYVFLPNDINGLTWVYNKNTTGEYFCLTGNIEKENFYNALVEFTDDLNKDSYFIDTNCGSTTNFTVTPNFGLAPQVSVTFYVK